ncbi:PAS domain-containing protein [Niveispirillum sp.]|uniref:PAS domain-containing protein n=1 Tax=Niveispirillum sp. TaxID=1917217 RepID=UPI001B5D3472|nr:PAS domain-containing protein [Niveispirillum sp.]MBP7335850.1 PAS domain-containing protein [Niveispirillum sp.]
MLDSVAAIGELFKHFPVPIMAWWQQSGHLSLAFCNSAFAHLCGRDPEGMTNVSGSLLMPLDGQPDPGPAIARSLVQGGVLDIEVSVSARGRSRRLRVLGQGLGVGNRQREHIFFAIARDISNEARQATAMATTERMLSAVITNIHLPLLMLTQDARIILANPAAARLLERPVDEVVGQHLSVLFTSQDWPGISVRFETCMRNAVEQRGAVRIRTGRGDLVDMEVRGQPMGDIGGKPMLMLTFSPFEPVPVSNHDGLDAMRKTLAGGGNILAGRVQIIGLDDMRSAFGERWGHMREQALGIAEQTIRRDLDPADNLQRMPDDSFVMNFSGLTETEAVVRAQRIADNVRVRLLGAATPDGRVEAVVTTVRATDLAGHQGEDLADFLVRKLAARRDESRRYVQALLREAITKATLDPRQVMRPEGFALPLQVAELAYPWRQQIATAMTTLGDDVAARFEADLVILSVSIDWGELRKRKRTLIVPVQLENLMLPRLLDRYVDVIRNLPVELRERILLHLVDIPSAIAGSRIGGMVQTLGPHCHGIILQLPTMDHMLDPLGNRVGVISLPFDMLDYGEQNGHARLTRLVRTCHLRKMKVWIEDVPDNNVSMKLAADGVDMVTLLR